MSEQLGTLLVRANRLQPSQLENALRRQAEMGGRLGTNLIELGLMGPDLVAAALSNQRRIPAATQAELDAISPTVLALLPRELAARILALPLRAGQGALVVAMASPWDLDAVRVLEDAVKRTIVAKIAPELRILDYLEKWYRVPHPRKVLLSMPATLPEAAPEAAPEPETPFRQLAEGEFLSSDEDDPYLRTGGSLRNAAASPARSQPPAAVAPGLPAMPVAAPVVAPDLPPDVSLDPFGDVDPIEPAVSAPLPAQAPVQVPPAGPAEPAPEPLAVLESDLPQGELLEEGDPADLPPIAGTQDEAPAAPSLQAPEAPAAEDVVDGIEDNDPLAASSWDTDFADATFTPPERQATPQVPTSPVTPIVAPVAARVAAPVAIPVEAPAAIPVAAPATIPVAAPATIPVAAPATIPVAAPAAIPVAAPAAIPVAAPATIPVADPATIPVADPAAIPIAATIVEPELAPAASAVQEPPEEVPPLPDPAFVAYRPVAGMVLVEDAIARASRPERVIESLLWACEGRFEAAAFFILEGTQASSRQGFGPSGPLAADEPFSVSLSEPSLLRAAVERGTAVLTRSRDPVDVSLCTRMGISPDRAATAIPFLIRGSAVAVLWGGCGELPERPQLSDEIERLASLGARAFARMPWGLARGR